MITTQTTTGRKAGEEAIMATTTTRTFQASVFAADAIDAIKRVEKHLAKVPGFALTGTASKRSASHRLGNACFWSVEIADQGGDVDKAWVILTSYGISPDATLGSHWEKVEGVGC